MASYNDDRRLEKREEDCSMNPKSCKSLREAAKQGDLEAVKYFVEEKKVSVDGPRSNGMINTPLCEAVYYRHLEVVKYFVGKNANVNKKCQFNIEAIDFAISTHQLEVVKYLAENGVDLMKIDLIGSSFLHNAVNVNSLEIVKYLVEQCQLNINNFNIDKNTPLHLAAEYGYLEIVRYLVENKADSELINNDGKTALDLAKEHSQNEIVEYLQSLKEKVHRSVKSNILKSKNSENNQDIPADGDCSVEPKTCKSLHEAARKGSLEAAKYFLEEKKVNVNGKKSAVIINTPLCEATANGHLQIVKYLVEKNANVNKKCIFYMSALMLAVHANQIEIFKFLVENGADISTSDVSGNSLLHIAALRSYPEIVKYLVQKHEVEINDLNNEHDTPLHFAAEHGSLEIVKYLVEKNVDVNATNRKGKTPLDLAKEYSRNDVVEYFQSLKGKSRRGVISYIEEVEHSVNNLRKNTEKLGKHHGSAISSRKSRKFSRNIYNPSYKRLISPLITSKEFDPDKSENEEVKASTMPSNFISTLFLLDLVVRYFTKQKFINTSERSNFESEAQENALKITENFEDLLKFYGSIPAEQVDLAEIHSNIHKAIKSGRGDKIHEILCSHLKLLSNLNPTETHYLVSAVLTNNPRIKLPKAELSDASVSADLPFLLSDSCIYSPNSPNHFRIK